MSWPLSQDYNEAVQTPARNFADADLRRGTVATNALGLPMPYSGNFADVYEVRCPDGQRWAVKCFTREVPGLHQRYDAISNHLRQARLPFTVDFSYLGQGIRVAGRWFPVLKMQWVEGLTLNQFVARAADKPATLESLLQVWARMGKYLREAEVGHCDLQHGNVLLVPGSGSASLALKLVDYDGMWVPALAGSASGEVGHPSYQHPQRAEEGAYNLEVDRFPLLLVATALRALKSGGRPLWDRYDNGDNLLFTEADLQAPSKSPLFLDLIRSEDATTAAMAKALVDALRGGVASAPLPEELMPEVRPLPPRPPPRTTRPGAKPDEPDDLDEAEEPAGPVVSIPAGVKRPPKAAVPVAAGIGAAAALMVIAGAVSAFFLLKGDRDRSPPTALALAEQAPGRPNAPPKVVPAGDSSERKREPGNTQEPPPAPPDPPPAEIDPTPNGPIGEMRQFEGHAGEIRRLAVSPDGRRLLTGSLDHTFRLWDIASGKELRQWDGHSGQNVYGVAFLPDGKRALTGGFDKVVHLWNLDGGSIIRSFNGHSQGVWYVAVSGDGRVAASCGIEETVFLWDVDSGKELFQLGRNLDGVETVAVSRDGKLVLTGGMKGRIRLWDTETGAELHSWQGHDNYVMGLAFSPDGKTALSASTDRTVRVWSVGGAPRELRRFEGVTCGLVSAALSGDGTRALTGGEDDAVRLWDVNTGKELYAFRGHKGRPWTVAFSPDGRYAYSAGQDKVVRMWRLPPADFVPARKEPPPIARKPAVPDDDALAAADKEVKEVHKAEYAKKRTADMKALAALLLKKGIDTKGRPAARYVLLREARDLAARAGDVLAALRAAEEMANTFDVDVRAMKAEALEAAGHKGASAAVQRDVAVIALALADDADEADQYEAAERFAKAAQASAATLTGLPLAAAAPARLREATAVRKAYDAVADSVAALAARPDDADANLALGRFHALARGDWDRGLVFLARGSDAKLKALAETDLAVPADADAAANLGDAYAAEAAAESGSAKGQLACRACYWYGWAAARLSGIDRTKVEKKYLALEKSVSPQRPVVLFARYGANRGWADVTERIRWVVAQAGGQRAVFKRSDVDLATPDPSFGEHKSLVVVYRYRTAIYLRAYPDNPWQAITPGRS
jgi:WD40 repeat protein